MKEIKIQDVYNLQKEFLDYCNKRTDLHEFPFLVLFDTLIEVTLKHIEEKIKDQKEMRAMFRTIYKIIGKDYSSYVE